MEKSPLDHCNLESRCPLVEDLEKVNKMKEYRMKYLIGRTSWQGIGSSCENINGLLFPSWHSMDQYMFKGAYSVETIAQR